MSGPMHLAIFALLAAGAPAMAQPLEPEQASLLEQARETAIRYSASLPDFLCTEVVRRTQDPQGNGRWRSMDTLTVKLSYFDHKEDYKLMQIDGKPTLLEFLYVGGTLSTGEFGTRLYSVFDPRSQGDFRWKGWTTLRKRRVARFSYRIARENSIFQIQYGPISSGPNAIVVPYHGEVFVDDETHMVLRQAQHHVRFIVHKDFPVVRHNDRIRAGRYGSVLDLEDRILARDAIRKPGHAALAQSGPTLPAEIPLRTRIENRVQARAEFAGAQRPAHVREFQQGGLAVDLHQLVVFLVVEIAELHGERVHRAPTAVPLRILRPAHHLRAEEIR